MANVTVKSDSEVRAEVLAGAAAQAKALKLKGVQNVLPRLREDLELALFYGASHVEFAKAVLSGINAAKAALAAKAV